MSKIVELIKQDHRAVENLFEEFEQTGNFETARQICAELTAHALLEEEMIYPILRTLTKEELYQRAQELDIQGRSDMNKDQLIAAIETEMKSAGHT